MGQSNARQNAIAAITAWPTTGVRVNASETPVRQLFGVNVFSDEVMRSRLPEATYKALRATIKRGAALDANIADVAAAAMKEWAMERGATHYTHWFQPMTGLTAEKHDSFFDPRRRGRHRHRRPSPAPRSPRPSRTPPASHRAASAPPSKRAATRRGTSTSPAYILREPERQYSLHPDRVPAHGPARRSTTRPRCCARCRRLSKQALPRADAARLQRLRHGPPRAAGPEQEYFLIDKQLLFRPPRPA